MQMQSPCAFRRSTWFRRWKTPSRTRCGHRRSNYSLDGELPACPCEISGGDITNNIYTYRDHAPLPLPINWRGDVRCVLKPAGSEVAFSISGAAMQLEQIETPRYIRHIKK